MASLRTMVGTYRDELREGCAMVAFWKNGCSWNAEAFWLDGDDRIEPEDMERVAEILDIDPHAIILDGYNDCPFTNYDENGKASSIEFMMEHIAWRYEERMCQLSRFAGALI